MANDPDAEAAREAPDTTFMMSERLWYRATEASDAPMLASLRNDPRVRRTTPPRFPSTVEAARKAIEARNPWQRGVANDHAEFVFGLKGAPEPLGITALFVIDWLNRLAEFGISIRPVHWNQGYGREVAAKMLEYAFVELSLRRVELNVLAGNPGGIRAYQAAGFVPEGNRRQSDCVDGRWEDLLIMGALRDEWLAHRKDRTST